MWLPGLQRDYDRLRRVIESGLVEANEAEHVCVLNGEAGEIHGRSFD